ncbi:MAG: hypothetical protein JNK72_05800 [Myxococcales bacterium]|nr:hypothetical protein [Myxococcales bacterium]
MGASRMMQGNRVAALLTAAVAVMSGGCADDSPSIFIRSIVAQVPMGTFCTVPLDQNGTRITEGRLDLSVSNSYQTAAVIQSQLVARADQTSGRTESNIVQIDGFEVEVHDQSPDGPIINQSAFGVPQSTVIPASVGGQVSAAVTIFEAIPPALVTQLRNGAQITVDGQTVTLPPVCVVNNTGVTNECPVPSFTSNDRRLIVRFRAYGRTLGGVEVQTPYYDHPVNVCCHCLVRFPADANAPETAMGAVANPDCNNGVAPVDQSTCSPGQDFPMDCRACPSNGPFARDAVCQPRGYSRVSGMSCPR